MIHKADVLIFDMDGTLFDTKSIYPFVAFKGLKVFYKKHKIKTPLPTKKEIMALIGQPLEIFYPALLPENLKHKDDELRSVIHKFEKEEFEKGKGRLIDGALEVLKYFEGKNKKMYIASNCGIDYLNAAVNNTLLKKYIYKAYCMENVYEGKRVPKKEIVRFIKNQNKNKKIIMIGDRESDAKAAAPNEILSVGIYSAYAQKNEYLRFNLILNKISVLKDIIY